ncbi:MAG: phosphoadenylyl-sulfate reductase [Cyclobacteriaceae bacterium]|nr:phosphoadenylyl-sulfate reductase [Cyclobacteriaceae bacterium]
MEVQKHIEQLEKELIGKTTEEQMASIADVFGREATFSSSFGYEDQVVSHMIFSANLGIEVFTLDTGRNFPETYKVWSRTLERYGKPIVAYYPDATEIEAFVSSKGPNAIYDSIDNRKQCCFIRKVAPLRRALKGKKIWITGIRAEQTAHREGMKHLEWDEANQIIKFNPLLNWTWDEVRAYVRLHNIPYNSLHDQGFPSIGCQPCTRAVKNGENPRAGRWWWEDQTKRECGLHVGAK